MENGVFTIPKSLGCCLACFRRKQRCKHVSVSITLERRDNCFYYMLSVDLVSSIMLLRCISISVSAVVTGLTVITVIIKVL